MSQSGLNRFQRARARRLVRQAAYVGLANAQGMHYTQGPQRWSGIDTNRRHYRGEFPAYSDCSAFATWCVWDATRRYRPQDFVNGAGWKHGYTGTMQDHGRRVGAREKMLPGDMVFYGDQGGGVAEHVAVYVGKGLVISHGSEGGPYLVHWRYRPVAETRRYLR